MLTVAPRGTVKVPPLSDWLKEVPAAAGVGIGVGVTGAGVPCGTAAGDVQPARRRMAMQAPVAARVRIFRAGMGCSVLNVPYCARFHINLP
jgi:hypothetical protein